MRLYFTSLRFGLFLLLSSLPLLLHAQQRYTLTGYVRSGADRSVLPGASVALPSLGTGVTADAEGFYTLTLPEGRYQLVISFIGYQTQTRDLNVNRSARVSFSLPEASNQ